MSGERRGVDWWFAVVTLFVVTAILGVNLYDTSCRCARLTRQLAARDSAAPTCTVAVRVGDRAWIQGRVKCLVLHGKVVLVEVAPGDSVKFEPSKEAK